MIDVLVADRIVGMDNVNLGCDVARCPHCKVVILDTHLEVAIRRMEAYLAHKPKCPELLLRSEVVA